MSASYRIRSAQMAAVEHDGRTVGIAITGPPSEDDVSEIRMRRSATP